MANIGYRIGDLTETTTVADADNIEISRAGSAGSFKMTAVNFLKSVLPGLGRTVATLAAYLFNNAVCNLKDYGAVGDGIHDDTAAIQAWYAAIEDGGVGVIPVGRFRFTAALSWNRTVSVVGRGPGSCLMPDLASAATDAITVNNTPNASLYRVRLDNFAILNDTANCCRSALVLNRVHNSEINVHVKAAAASYGTVINGCLVGKWRIVTSVNFTYPYPAAMPVNNVHVTRDVVNAIACNANDIDVIIEGGGNGVYIEDQNGEGNNHVRGTIEGLSTATHAVYAGNCTGLNLSDLHSEANSGKVELVNCAGGRLGPNLFIGNGSSETGNTIALTGSHGVRLDGVNCGSIAIDAASDRCEIGLVEYNNSGTGSVADLSPTTVYRGLLRNAGSPNSGMAAGGDASDAVNLHPNGNFERWPSGGAAVPADWSYFGSPLTWVRTGTGMTDTLRKFSRYAAKVTTPTAADAPAYDFDWAANANQWVTVWQWVYIPGGGPSVSLQCWFDAGAAVVGGQSTSLTDQWVCLRTSFYLNDTSYNSGTLLVKGSAGGTFYLANGGYVRGLRAPHKALAPPTAALAYYVGGAKWSAGTGVPNSAVVGSPGDIYTRLDGGASTTLYVKESGTNTNTGWIAK